MLSDTIFTFKKGVAFRTRYLTILFCSTNGSLNAIESLKHSRNIVQVLQGDLVHPVLKELLQMSIIK